MRSPSALVARVIRNRANRTLWWLITLALAAFAVLGPPAAALGYSVLWGVPVSRTLTLLLGVNLVVFISIAVGLALFLRVERRVSAAQAIGATAVAAVAATVVRGAALSLLDPPNWWRFSAFLLLISFLFVMVVTVAVLYGNTLEDALSESFAANARTQQALSHEEESVRAQVFDELHGSLQAEFVAMRRILDDLAERTPDPGAATTARAMEVRLEGVYRRGVETVARALSPAGLEAGLVPAVRELEARLAGAVEVDLQVDPIVTVLDDPTMGGIRRDVRVAAYRVIEEAVSNASRHSDSTHVTVHLSSMLRQGRPQLQVRVENATTTMGAIVDGQGLTRMRSRVTALEGDVRITATKDSFAVSARLPLQAPDDGG